ncbi:MAG TPA: metallophosphoesterase [Gaiellaceae bacterium]|nr:metallophosphoesterase [Gaiellaceae bacterium]
MARPIRVAAAGDVHCDEVNRDEIERAFVRIQGEVDAILLAGDLTTYGELEQAELLAAIVRPLATPVYAVLGNHDWHCREVPQLVAVLEEAGLRMIDRRHAVLDVAGATLGIAGVKGFVGGFPDATLPDFGEPLLREVYAETTAEVEALESGLAAIGGCDHRIALLHYAPTTTTLEGEPRGIWAFLGSDRLAAPILEHRPDLVLHGHAHVGAFQGAVGDIPVYNVAVPSLARDFFVFELDAGSVRVAT